MVNDAPLRSTSPRSALSRFFASVLVTVGLRDGGFVFASTLTTIPGLKLLALDTLARIATSKSAKNESARRRDRRPRRPARCRVLAGLAGRAGAPGDLVQWLPPL